MIRSDSRARGPRAAARSESACTCGCAAAAAETPRAAMMTAAQPCVVSGPRHGVRHTRRFLETRPQIRRPLRALRHSSRCRAAFGPHLAPDTRPRPA